MGIAVRLEKIAHRYAESEESSAVEALKEVTLDIPAGQFLVLMGPSGSGKSTLLNLIGAVDRPTSGRLFIGDAETSAMSERELTLLRRTGIGFIFQFFNLIPTLTVAENVAFPLALLKRPAKQIQTRVEELVGAVGLSGRATHFPHQLSGGEMQRVAMARAIVHEPALILADEPTGNLDTHTGESILELIGSIHRQLSPTIVMATHSDRAAACGDAIVHVIDGKLDGLS
jgi:putative ABC transport system ATP-binding protein